MQQSSTSMTTSDFECFQNYTSSEVFVHQLAGLVNPQDISTIIRNQKQMLQRFEKTNEMLLNVNQLSQSRLSNITEEYKKNSKLLIEMKKDLEYIFKKIRTIKSKMEAKYPEAFEQAKRQNMQNLEETDENDEENINYEQLESIKNIDNIDNDAMEALDS
ncbi:hypothetical protein PVAND_010794 [Polypedilum vanderplanki]|uniref:KxDL domain-containing protein n=1 Tax=Polypedilum vanderplanki TaxID=319348 RepID=A0A9J6CIE7_POLVA|nr:hypothetical protein PVAND_010794 [Polypedilum vanderplanki]